MNKWPYETKCGLCGAPVLLVLIPRGRVITCDREQVHYKAHAGQSRVVTPNEEITGAAILPDSEGATGVAWRWHGESCPVMERWNRNRYKKELEKLQEAEKP